jgi:hypothetical protein
MKRKSNSTKFNFIIQIGIGAFFQGRMHARRYLKTVNSNVLLAHLAWALDAIPSSL